MGPRKKTVVDDLLEYINPTPATVDSDGELDAAVAGEWYESSEEERGETLPSRGRKRGLDVSEYDERYAGRKLSRRELGGLGSLASPGQDGGEDSVSESGGGGDSDGGSTGDSESSGGSDSGGEDDSEGEGPDSGTEQDNFQHLSRHDPREEMDKGKAVKQQLEMWDNLLECRIRFQKCLLAANCLPRHEIFKEVMCDRDPELKAATNKMRRSISQLLGKLVELRTRALELFVETAHVGQDSSQRKDVGNDSDEEIPSSGDDDARSVADEDTQARRRTMERPLSGRKMSTRAYEEMLKEAHESYRGYRNATIQKWNDKTRVAVGKLSNKNFSAFEQSTVKQIEQVLSDRRRLVQRSQLKRVNYEVLGQDKEGAEERNTEMFDDGDWYQQLVRELIERKCESVSDPAQLGQQWLQLQKLRSKMKRKVDTRATKGRKVSYVVHPKLVSFMAPVGGDEWSDAARSELYGSLFGGAAPQ